MKHHYFLASVIALSLCLAFAVCAPTAGAADWTDAQTQAEVEARERVPQGGNFQPNPQVPAIVAVGRGGRIVLSTDDGESWEQVFFEAPSHAHGYWTARSVAYTNGLFVLSSGGGKPPIAIASDDGRDWRHLLPPISEQQGEITFDPLEMPGAWTMAGGGGTLVASRYLQSASSP